MNALAAGLLACAAAASRAGAVAAPDLAVAKASAQTRLEDGTLISYELTGDAQGNLKGLSVSLTPASPAREAVTAVLILVPASGGGQSAQFSLSPPPQAGKASNWDLSPQLAAAVQAGRLESPLEGGSQAMLQLLRPDKKTKRKGDAIAPPLVADWLGAPAGPRPPAAAAPADGEFDLGPPSPRGGGSEGSDQTDGKS